MSAVLIPLRPGSRVPAIGGWNTPDYVEPQEDDPIWQGGAAVHAGRSGFIILDVDVKHGKDGFASLKDREALPPTFYVDTPSGGRHYYFRAPEGFEGAPSVDKVGRGLDIRAGDSYVLAPFQPGYVAHGTSADIVPAPAWLVPYAKKRARSERDAPPRGDGHPAGVKALLDRIDLAGGKLDYMQWIKCLSAIKHDLGDAGFDMAVAWSMTYPDCDPSDIEMRWDGLGLDDNPVARGTLIHLAGPDGAEVYRKAKEAAIMSNARERLGARAEALRPVKAHQELEPEPAAAPGEAHQELEPAAEPEPEPEPEPAPAAGTKRIRLMDFSEPEYVEPLIDDCLGAGETAILFGPSGAGKSFAAIDMSLSVVYGVPFHGKATRQGPVIYFAGEGEGGLRHRARAWLKRHKLEDQGNPGFFLPTEIPVLPDAESVTEWIEEILELAEQLETMPRLLVFDTLATSTAGHDENAAQTATAVVANLKALRSVLDPRITILLVHHSGLGEPGRMRGSSAWFAGADRVIRFEADGESLTKSTLIMTWAKVKDGETPAPQRMVAVREVTGRKPDGDEIYTPVLMPAAAKPGDVLKTDGARSLWRLFEAMEPDIPVAADGSQPVPVEMLRSAFAAQREGKSKSAISMAFKRAWQEIVAKKLVTAKGEEGSPDSFLRARGVNGTALDALAEMRETTEQETQDE